ncbi:MULTISPECIES: YecA family protein [Rhizobium]|uniref:YecA family protein n=1 Tax=Rhizobium TaxID=379 RepID=UPI00140D13E6|nr:MULTISPECIES: SEC-C domain-containing protein [Rhizobium]MDG3575117.1 SEC-C domain-containing protein [Rhizobium sp. YJ-22]
MTLSIAYISGSLCVVATDRRISGGYSDDEHGKTIALFAGDGIAAVSFAGLARVSHFDTHDWLASSLVHRGGTGGNLRQIIQETANDLTKRFAGNQTIKSVDHRLSILFAGYGLSPTEYHPFFALVSNFQHPDGRGLTPEFRAYLHQLLPGGAHLASAIGDYSAIAPSVFADLKARCKGKGVDQVEQILVGGIRNAGLKSETIGQQIMTLSLNPFQRETIRGRYHSAAAKPELFMPSMVWAQPDTRIAVTRASIVPEDETDHRFVFPAKGRNARCLCGSGKKYKRCHGAP